jgi:hypothetical protein
MAWLRGKGSSLIRRIKWVRTPYTLQLKNAGNAISIIILVFNILHKFMKYIKNPFNFRRSKSVYLPEDNLYTPLTEDEYYDFTVSHEFIDCDNLVIDSIRNFMKSEPMKRIKYDIKLFKNYDMESDEDEYSDRIILDLFGLEHNSNHSGPQNLNYRIDKFEDDWFLVKIQFLMHDFVHFKCDTINVVYQLILNYKNYIKNKS